MSKMFTQNGSNNYYQEQWNDIMQQIYFDRQFQLEEERTTTAAANIKSTIHSISLEPSFLETLIWSLLFYPMVIFAAIGNLLIIWIIATKPLMRNIMNQYLVNLTLSDFLSVTFNASFNFVFMLNQHWPFGKIYCIANNFIANLTIVSSVSTMMFISIDRYYAIVHPLKSRQTKRRFFSIIAIWSLSIIFSLPPLIYSDTEDLAPINKNDFPLFPFNHNASINTSWLLLDLFATVESTTNKFDNATLNYLTNKMHQTFQTPLITSFTTISPQLEQHAFVRTLCIMRWPDGVSGFSTYEFLYNMAFLIFFYVIPVLTMVVALSLMSRVLWPKEHIGEHTTIPQHTLLRSKRKVVCMLICVISVFALCWLPYHSYFICIYWWPSLIKTQGIKHIYLGFYWFAMANSLFNPLILFAMNRRIRNYIKSYLKCTCCMLPRVVLKKKKREEFCRNIHPQTNSIKMIIHQKQNPHAFNQRQQQSFQHKSNYHYESSGTILSNNSNQQQLNNHQTSDNSNHYYQESIKV